MAVCDACEGEMLDVFTCLLVERPGVVLFGDEDPELDYPDRCHDCFVRPGGVHHPGCCVAWCEHCDEQRLCCGCDADEDDDAAA